MAERIVFGEVSSGAADDPEEFTRLVRRMVCRRGMCETLGPAVFEPDGGWPFLGKELSGSRARGEDAARMIDEEIRRMPTEMEASTEGVPSENRARLDALVPALPEKETPDRETNQRGIRDRR